MAIVFMDGFDHYSTDDPADDLVISGWSYLSSNAYVNSSTTTELGYGKSIYTTSGNTWLQKRDLTQTSNITFGVRARSNATIPVSDLFVLYESTDKVMNLDINASGQIVVQDNSGTTQDTSTNVLSEEEWFYIEVSVYSNASGTVVVDINGEEWLNTTGIDTGTGIVDGVMFQLNDNWFFDDIYISNDLVRLGNPRIFTLYTSGAGTGSSDWTNDYTYIDDDGTVTAATRDSTYISRTTAGTEHIAFDDLPAGDWDIKAVRPTVLAVNPDGGSPTYAVTTDQGATETSIATGGTYAASQGTHIYADGSSTAWTPTLVNGLEIAIEYE